MGAWEYPRLWGVEEAEVITDQVLSGWRWCAPGIAHPFSFVSPGPRMMEASAVNSSQWLLHSS